MSKFKTKIKEKDEDISKVRSINVIFVLQYK